MYLLHFILFFFLLRIVISYFYDSRYDFLQIFIPAWCKKYLRRMGVSIFFPDESIIYMAINADRSYLYN